LGKGFSGEQLASAALENLAVSLENRHGPVEDPVDNPLHRSIDLLCCCLAVPALDIGVADLVQEAGSTVVIADEAELLVHAVSHHHGASDVRGLGKVIRGARREMAKDKPLCGPSTQEDSDLVL